MRVVIALDSFKGSIGAAGAAAALASGWHAIRPGDEVVCVPLADGGEGTLDVLATAVSGARWHQARVTGPAGQPVDSAWLELPGGLAATRTRPGQRAAAAGPAGPAGRADDRARRDHRPRAGRRGRPGDDRARRLGVHRRRDRGPGGARRAVSRRRRRSAAARRRGPDAAWPRWTWPGCARHRPAGSAACLTCAPRCSGRPGQRRCSGRRRGPARPRWRGSRTGSPGWPAAWAVTRTRPAPERPGAPGTGSPRPGERRSARERCS